LVGFDVAVVHQKTEYMVVLWLGLSLVSSFSKHNIVILWLGLSLLSSVNKHNTWSYYVWVCRCCLWLYYDWVCRCCRPSINTICGSIMDGFVGVVVRQKTQYMVGVVVVVCQ
jgi:hypothetical protein